MQYLPTTIDIRNASLYALYIKRNKLLEKNVLNLPINITERDFTSNDLNGIFDFNALGKIKNATWSKDCTEFNCSPYDINGELCKPLSRKQLWKTIDGSVYSGCEESCYGIFSYDENEPKPSGLPLRYINESNKCVLRNVGKDTWFTNPNVRADVKISGLTNVPPFVLHNNGAITVPKSYCDWFGLEYDENEDICFRPWYQMLLEDYLIGSTLYRAFTVKRGEPVGFSSFSQLINSEEYHISYQRMAATLKRIKPEFEPYRNTKYLFKNITYYNFKPIERELYINQEDGDYDFNSIWDDINDNVVLSLIRDVLIDLSTDKLLALVKEIMQSFAKWLERLVPETIEILISFGGKTFLSTILRSAITSAVLRAAGNAIIKGTSFLVSSLSAIIEGFNIVQLSVGIAGLILDLIDVLDLNQYMDSDNIESIALQFDQGYISAMRTKELSVDPIDILALKNQDDENESDQYLNSLIYSSIYLQQLQYNSLGQKLNWNDDTNVGNPKPPTRTDTVNNILFGNNITNIDAYNETFITYIKSQKTIIKPLGIGVAILSVASACFLFSTKYPVLKIITIFLIILWLFYQLMFLCKKYYFETQMYNITLMLLKVKN